MGTLPLCEHPNGHGLACGLELGHPNGPADRHIALVDSPTGSIGTAQWPRDRDGEWAMAGDGRYYPVAFLLNGHEHEVPR